MIKVRNNLAGQTFGRLTVIEQAEDYISPGGKHYSQWLCECSCDKHTKIIVPSRRLVCGDTKSCGCYRKEKNKERSHKINQYELDLKDEYGEYGVGTCTNSEIQFLFDMEDYEKIKDYCWSSHYKGNYICISTTINQKIFYLHQIIIGKNYDHIDRNPLNNRKYNLRKATVQQNNMNRSVSRNNTSGVTGVYYENSTNKWRARIEYLGQIHYLGRYENKEDAIIARLKAEKEYFKEFAPQQHLYAQYNII